MVNCSRSLNLYQIDGRKNIKSTRSEHALSRNLPCHEVINFKDVFIVFAQQQPFVCQSSDFITHSSLLESGFELKTLKHGRFHKPGTRKVSKTTYYAIFSSQIKQKT